MRIRIGIIVDAEDGINMFVIGRMEIHSCNELVDCELEREKVYCENGYWYERKLFWTEKVIHKLSINFWSISVTGTDLEVDLLKKKERNKKLRKCNIPRSIRWKLV